MRTPALGVVMTAVSSLLAACVAPPEVALPAPGRFVLAAAAGYELAPDDGPSRAVELPGGVTDGGPAAAGPPEAPAPSEAPSAEPSATPTPSPSPSEYVRNSSGGGGSGGGSGGGAPAPTPTPTPTPTPEPGVAIDVTPGGFSHPAAAEAAVVRP